MAFKYRGGNRTVEAVNRKAQQSGGAFDSFIKGPTLKLRDGENCLRILPPPFLVKVDGEEQQGHSEDAAEAKAWGFWWNIDLYLHYEVGPDNATYLCLDKMKGQPCPVCDARGEAQDADEVAALRASWRGICYVIDRDNEKAGPQIWSLPVSLFREINERSVDKKHKTPILVDDPDEGYDIVFNKSGQGIKTKYSGMEIMRDSSPLHDDKKIQDRWLDYIMENPLPTQLVFHEAEYIEKVLLGKSRPKREDDDRSDAEREEDARSQRRGRRTSEDTEEEERPRRRAVRDEDTEEERPRRRASSSDDDEEETKPMGRRGRSSSDDDEEETKPAGRPGRAAASDEEEEAPWDGEEEDKPTRRRSTKGDDEDVEENPSEQARSSLARMRERRAARG